MNEKKDKKSQKPECVSKNWKPSQGIRLLAMVLAIVSGFFVAVTGVITVTLGMTSDLQGSQKDIEKTLDTELLRSYAYWMGDAVTGISKKQDEADALKKFDDGNIVHVDGSVNPLRDIETINFELIFSDIEVLDRRIAKSTKGSRNDKSLAHEVEFLSKVKAHLEDGKLAKTFEVDDEEDQEILNSCNLLTIKPVIFAANVNEDELAGEDNDYVKAVREYAADVDAKVFVVCAQIEQEISELDDDEKKEFLEDLGLEESGLEKLISASYSLLGLISFLTSGEDETRAWTIKEGTKAPQAAGKIHTDFERGFICAEVVSFEDLKEYGTMQACKEKGLVRQEGKEYVVKDGDIIVFRFNV